MSEPALPKSMIVVNYRGAEDGGVVHLGRSGPASATPTSAATAW